MANENRPNYFLLLGIDPGDPWDPAAFETLLRTKRGEWSRLVPVGVKTSKAVIAAQFGLANHDKIKQVMTNRVQREEERLEALRQSAAEPVRRRAEFDLDLRIMLGKGFLWDTEVRALRQKYPEIGTDPELATRVNGVSTRAIDEEYVVPDQLDQSMANTISALLDLLGEKSLYTLLASVDSGIDEQTRTERLVKAANALYDDLQGIAEKNDQLSAKQGLAGHAMQVFKTAEWKSRYDNTLALAPVVALIGKYQSALAPIKRVEADQVERFVNEASAAGVEAQVAIAMLAKHFEGKNWTIQVPPNVAQARPGEQRCAGCRSWNDTDNEFCVVCGARQRVTCPRCDRTVPGHGACAKCGFPVGDYDWAGLLVRDCADLAGQDDLAGAQEKLAAATQAWPSEGDDELAMRLKDCRVAVAEVRERHTAEDERTAAQLRTLAEQRSYHAVLTRATNARTTVPDRELFIREATERIREADRCCDLAERTASTPDRLNHYARALTDCADHKRAELALNALPPLPPQDLRVESSGSAINLTWEPSGTDDVRYAVVRKPGGVPTSTTDGARIATIRRTSCQDAAPDTGVDLHYAVFAQRPTGIASEHGATADPVFVAGEITVTSQRVYDGAVELGWQLPTHATGVDIQRTAAATTTNVTATEPTRLRDEGLVNGVSHTYTLRAGFPSQHGSRRLSAGVSVSLTPGVPPALPGPVSVQTVPRNLGVAYRLVDLVTQDTAPGAGAVLSTRQRPPIRPGEQYPISELSTYGSLLGESAALGVALPFAGLYYFAEVVIHHGVGYVGDIRRYAARDEVGELTARDLGDTIRLSWTWPAGCTAALVAYDHDGWPPDPTVAGDQVLTERVGNDRTGSYDVPSGKSMRGQQFYFVVAVAEHRDGELFVSTGSRCTAAPASGKLGIRMPRKGRVSR